MSGVRATQIEVAGSKFAVRRTGDRIEALRISPEAGPSRSETLRKASIAILGATGCGIRTGSLSGDQAVIRAELDCVGTKPPFEEKAVPVLLDCGAGEIWRIDGLDQTRIEVDCFIVPRG